METLLVIQFHHFDYIWEASRASMCKHLMIQGAQEFKYQILQFFFGHGVSRYYYSKSIKNIKNIKIMTTNQFLSF